MSQYTVVHTEEINGYDIELAVTEETSPLEDLFDDSVHDLEELSEKVNTGELVHFIARVQAKRCGCVLGEDYLGSCMYKSVEEFHTTYRNDYYMDMVNSAIKEAKETLNKLLELEQTKKIIRSES